MSSETDGAVTGAVVSPALLVCRAAPPLAAVRVGARGLLGSWCPLSPTELQAGSGSSQEKGGNPGRSRAGPAVCHLGVGGPVSQQSSAAGGDALTLARLLIAFVVKAEFSCPCCIIQCGCRS